MDLDRLQELATAAAGFLLYVAGAVGGAYTLAATFGAWVGFLLLLVAGLPPSVYSLRKASERRATREHAAAYRASQETSREAGTGGSIPVPRLP